MHARPFRGYILEMQSKHASLHVSRIGTLTYFVHQSERKKMNLCTKVVLFAPICRWFWDSSQQRMANLAIWRRGQRKLKPFCFLLGSLWNRWWRQKCGTTLKNLCVWQFGHRVIRSSSSLEVWGSHVFTFFARFSIIGYQYNSHWYLQNFAQPSDVLKYTHTCI